MNINDAGLAIIKESEGLRLKAYLGPNDNRWTIGFGHTGRDVYPGCPSITLAQALELLREDVQTAESDVTHAVKVFVNINEFSALVSFTMNFGGTKLRRSTLLELLNDDKRKDAAEQFTRWTKSGGVDQPGLVIRRHKERELFLTPVVPA